MGNMKQGVDDVVATVYIPTNQSKSTDLSSNEIRTGLQRNVVFLSRRGVCVLYVLRRKLMNWTNYLGRVHSAVGGNWYVCPIAREHHSPSSAVAETARNVSIVIDTLKAANT